MSFKLKNGQELPALDSNEIISVFEDSYVVEGCEVALGSSGMEVDIASGSVKVAGQEHNISGETVIIDIGDSDPRKDVIYVDDTGSVQIVKGDPELAIPNGNDRFNTSKPVPASLSAVDATVLAEVWVDADASSLSSDDIRDRRLFLDLETGGGGGDIIEAQSSEVANGNSGASATIDWTEGRNHKITLTDNVSLDFTNPDFVGRYDIRVVQDGTGGRDINWPSEVVFPDGEPDWTEGNANEEKIITIRFDDSGTYVAESTFWY